MFTTKEVWVVIFHDTRGFTNEHGMFESEEAAVHIAHEIVKKEFLHGWCTIERRIICYKDNESNH